MMKSLYNDKKQWTNVFSEKAMAFPSEYVIRIFKGEYPLLNLKKEGFHNKKICDVGCGDGRNFPLLQQCGFNMSGVEITADIVQSVCSNLQAAGILDVNVKVGTNASIPFEDNFFDYLLSWNACYYMGAERDFFAHVTEFARVLKSDAYLVLSIPKKTCFIYKDSVSLKPGYQIIKDDPFNVRNGAVLRMFQGEEDIKNEFGSYFKDFIFGSIEDDCFGFNYHWHLVICKKR